MYPVRSCGGASGHTTPNLAHHLLDGLDLVPASANQQPRTTWTTTAAALDALRSFPSLSSSPPGPPHVRGPEPRRGGRGAIPTTSIKNLLVPAAPGQAVFGQWFASIGRHMSIWRPMPPVQTIYVHSGTDAAPSRFPTRPGWQRGPAQTDRVWGPWGTTQRDATADTNEGSLGPFLRLCSPITREDSGAETRNAAGAGWMVRVLSPRPRPRPAHR